MVAAAAAAESNTHGGGVDVVFHVKVSSTALLRNPTRLSNHKCGQEMFKHMALAVEAVRDGRLGDVMENDRTFVLNGLVSALTDTDIASVFNEVGLPLWKLATTFAIGTPPEQLVTSLFAAAFAVSCHPTRCPRDSSAQ